MKWPASDENPGYSGIEGSPTMEHIGIDLDSKESQVCIRSSAGEILEEVRCPTSQLGVVLTARAPGRVVIETCTEAFRIPGLAVRHGHPTPSAPVYWRARPRQYSDALALRDSRSTGP